MLDQMYGIIKNPNKCLRIYKKGGSFGIISISDDNKSKLIDRKYAKYCSNSQKLENYISEAKKDEDVVNTLLNEEYLKLANEAFSNKWKKKNENKEAERDVETKIMRKYMNADNDFITIDMEVKCPEKWFETMTNDKEIEEIEKKLKKIDANGKEKNGLTYNAKFDIISFSEEGIGIIELKVENENTDNIESHYAHMKHVMNDENTKIAFLNEIKRRIPYLKKYKLIKDEIINKYEKDIFDNKKLWCGFLFVGGDKNAIINTAKKLENYEKINDIKFLYSPDTESLDFKNWTNYQNFINEEG